MEGHLCQTNNQVNEEDQINLLQMIYRLQYDMWRRRAKMCLQCESKQTLISNYLMMSEESKEAELNLDWTQPLNKGHYFTQVLKFFDWTQPEVSKISSYKQSDMDKDEIRILLEQGSVGSGFGRSEDSSATNQRTSCHPAGWTISKTKPGGAQNILRLSSPNFEENPYWIVCWKTVQNIQNIGAETIE